MLNDHFVEDALDSQIPITEEPAILEVSSKIKETTDESTNVSTIKVSNVISLRSIFSLNDTTSLINWSEWLARAARN